jgi:hypothetical protein
VGRLLARQVAAVQLQSLLLRRLLGLSRSATTTHAPSWSRGLGSTVSVTVESVVLGDVLARSEVL